MDNSKIKAKITNVGSLVELNLVIPGYQRAYRWSEKSVSILFDDIMQAFNDGNHEYRIGTVILHQETNDGDTVFNIVDGQQRLTTIVMLLTILGTKNIKLLKQNYQPLSHIAIRDNYQVLLKRVGSMLDVKKEKIRDFILKNCTVVEIITEKNEEAFQFFDSQNTRGKELAPHDLLKSFNLREMEDETEDEKEKIISNWETIDQKELKNLFSKYLYPIKRWYKLKRGIYYSVKEIDEFKGIKFQSNNNYAIYNKLSHINAEELIKTKGYINQYQLNQPIFVGKRFFEYVDNYNSLLHSVRQIINSEIDRELIPENGAGDTYIKELFECALMLYADRFGVKKIKKETLQQLYTWAYSLRLEMTAVYIETINNYAIGNQDIINSKISMFELINEMREPEELNIINFEKITKEEKDIKEKYKNIYTKINEWNNWEVKK
ncbi:MAG: DUF262 domain-containing protein [bacterium]